MFETGKGAKLIVEERGLGTGGDARGDQAFVDQAIAANPAQVEHSSGPGMTRYLRVLCGTGGKVGRPGQKRTRKMVQDLLRRKL